MSWPARTCRWVLALLLLCVMVGYATGWVPDVIMLLVCLGVGALWDTGQ